MEKETNDPQIEMNYAQRAIRIKSQISACLYTGSTKLASGFGNGDCILLDFGNLFFVVSDSTDRWPDASRNFLIKLMETLDERTKPENKEDWLEIVNDLYSRQKYLYRATFSGLALKTENNKKEAIIVHGGDSIILIVDTVKKKIKYQTDANMNFIGRAKCIPGSISVPINKDEIIIMGSDGIADIARLAKFSVEEMCIEAAARYSVDDVPHRIAHLLDSRKEAIQHDDIGIIAIDPQQINNTIETKLLMGGTMPEHERQFASAIADSTIPDEWFTINRVPKDPEILKKAGIIL